MSEHGDRVIGRGRPWSKRTRSRAEGDKRIEDIERRPYFDGASTIRRKRATTSLAASVDQTEARKQAAH
jgi:hypothetical protein